MDTKSHTRTKQIKRLSALIYRLLTVIYYGLFLGWAGMVFLIFTTHGNLSVGGISIPIEELSLVSRVFAIFFFSVGLFLMIRIASHFRELMCFFMQGEVFSNAAIHRARGALHYAILYYILSLALDIYWQWLAEEWFYERNISISANLIVDLIFFCFMYTLVWTLEIGSDLHDESEFTV